MFTIYFLLIEARYSDEKRGVHAFVTLILPHIGRGCLVRLWPTNKGQICCGNYVISIHLAHFTQFCPC